MPGLIKKQGNFMKSIDPVRVNEKGNCQNNRISVFFEKHAAVRKIVAYAPAIIIGGASLIEQVSSYKILPSFSVKNMAALSLLCFISGIVAGYDQSLQNKEIEHLNS